MALKITKPNMSSIDTTCISNTEFVLRIIVPCVNSLLGILTYIYNDNLLSPDGIKNMHIAIATVNVILMLLSLITEILKNRHESLTQYNDQIKQYNSVHQKNREVNRVNILPRLSVFPQKPKVMKDLIPFKSKLK